MTADLTVHRPFGGSTIARDIACPANKQLGKKVPKKKANPTYADPGSLKHNVMQKVYESDTKPDDLEEEVASILADGNVVAVCRGRMEFGPRALGHRSILYQPTDPTVNDWLNQKLRRTEFIPFAPVTRIEDSDRIAVGVKHVVV